MASSAATRGDNEISHWGLLEEEKLNNTLMSRREAPAEKKEYSDRKKVGQRRKFCSKKKKGINGRGKKPSSIKKKKRGPHQEGGSLDRERGSSYPRKRSARNCRPRGTTVLGKACRGKPSKLMPV